MRIGGFIKTTMQDWEGKNACMILLSGCNFRCPYCNRPDLVDGSKESISKEEVLRYIKENRDFLEAAVISGGEPTIDPDLYTLLKELKSLKIKVKIDTNGSNPDILDDILGAKLADKVCINLMAPLDDETYSKAAGVRVDTNLIKRSLKVASESGAKYEFRTVAVPSIITPDSMSSVTKEIRGDNSLIIQQFDPENALDPQLRAVRPYPVAELVSMANAAKRDVKHVRIRGTDIT